MSFWLDIDVWSKKRDENDVQRSFSGKKFSNPVNILPSLALFFKKWIFCEKIKNRARTFCLFPIELVIFEVSFIIFRLYHKKTPILLNPANIWPTFEKKILFWPETWEIKISFDFFRSKRPKIGLKQKYKSIFSAFCDFSKNGQTRQSCGGVDCINLTKNGRDTSF